MSGVLCVSPSVDINALVAALCQPECNVQLTISPYLTNKTTHYVTTEQEFQEGSIRVKNAQKKSIPIVREEFVHECIASNRVVEARPFLFSIATSQNDQVASADINDISFDSTREDFSTRIAKPKKLDPQRKREIRFFVSSTFRDMAEERAILMNQVFPQLQHLCQQRNVQISFIDLRWGITEEEGKGAKTIELCLQEIDRCRPYFLSFVGERYGWAQNKGFPYDSHLDRAFQNATKAFPWIREFRDRSVTELEIRHGALNRPSETPRSLFFFRDALSITKHFELGDPERDNYEEESSDGHEKLRALKDEIRQSGLPLIDGYTREQLPTFLLNALTAVIDADFPANEPAAQQSFAELTSSTVYHRVKKLHQALTDTVQQAYKVNDRHPAVALSGMNGTGKSTLLLQWMKERQEHHAKELVLLYPVSRDESTCFYTAAAGLLKLLSLHFNLSAFTLPTTADPDAIRTFFYNVLDAIEYQLSQGNSQYERCIIAMPGMHHLTDQAWYPSRFPPSIVFLVTAWKWSGKQLKIEMTPWSAEDKQAFVTKYLKTYSKKLDGAQIRQIVQSPSTNRVLFMRVVLDQLIYMATFDSLNASLKRYLAASSTEELFDKILEDWEDLFQPLGSPPLVVHTMSYLALTHSGLTEAELQALLGYEAKNWSAFYCTMKGFCSSHGSQNEYLVLYHDCMTRAVKKRYLLSGSTIPATQEKMRVFFYEALSEPARVARVYRELPYLSLAQGKVPARTQLPEVLSKHLAVVYQQLPLSDLVDFWKACEISTLMRLLKATISASRPSIDVLKQLLHVAERAWSTQHLAIFVSWLSDQYPRNAACEYLVAYYLEKGGTYRRAVTHITQCLENATRDEPQYCALAGLLMKKLGQYDAATRYYERACTATRSRSPVDLVALGQYESLHGDVERKLGHYENAVRHYQDAFAHMAAVLGALHPHLVEIYRNLGLLYKKMGQYDVAKGEYAKGLNVLEQRNMKNTQLYALMLNEIGDVYRKTGEYHTARTFYESSLDKLQQVCGEYHPEVAQVLNSIGILLKKQGKYAQALPMYTRSLSIIEQSFGKEHYKYAACVNNIGDLHRKNGNFERAIASYQEALEIFGATLGTKNSEYAEVLNNIGIVYKKQANYEQARQAYEQAIRICTSEFGAIHFKVGLYLANLADVFRKEAKHDKSLQIYEQAQEIISRCLGSDDVEVADIQQSRALVYIDQRRFREADDELFVATNLITHHLGADHPKIGYCLHKRGMLEHARGNTVEATNLLQQSLTVLRKSLDKYHPEIADVLITLGEVQASTPQEALKTFVSALEIVFFCFGKEHYKYQDLTQSIQELGGSVPDFPPPRVVSHHESDLDWRSALDNLISKSQPNDCTTKNSSKKSDQSNVLLVAMASGLI